MIFSPILAVDSPFERPVLDAINIFSRFSYQTLQDINAGFGGNIHEFEINKTLLDLSKYLNYTDPSELSFEQLKGYGEKLKAEDLSHSDEESVCGAHLLYLVLAHNGTEIMENISEEAYQAYREILILLQGLLQ